MAKVKLLKMHVLTLEDRHDELVQSLFALGAVHIVDVGGHLSADEKTATFVKAFQPNLRQLHLDLSRADFLCDFMERYGDVKKGRLGGLIPERFHITEAEWNTLLEDSDLVGLYDRCERLDVRYKQLTASASELEREIERLTPWAGLDMADLEGTVTSTVTAGLLPAKNWSIFVQSLEESCPHTALVAANRDARGIYMVAIVWREEMADFAALAQGFGFEQLAPRGLTCLCSGELERLSSELAAVQEEREALAASAREYSLSYGRIIACHDWLSNAVSREEAKGTLAHTERVIALEGWVPEERRADIEDSLEGLGEEMSYSFAEATEDDTPPILLRNHSLVKPAEGLISLFGLPNRHETDPTAIMAPFFIFFFGLCIGDVGYGAALILISWLMEKKLDVSDKAKNFFRLFIYCGWGSIIAGVLTRGYFGINADHLPSWMKFSGSFDTLNAPVSIMAFCAALGLLHIWTGLFIEMWDNARNNSWWDGLCEQGTTLLFWAALPVLVIGYAAKVGVLKSIGLYAFLAGAAGIVLLSNKSAKTWVGKLGGGLFNLYGSFGATVGDVASYMRLYALGLATVLIAEVVNRMGVMMFQSIPIFGVVLMLVIFAIGHSFNFIINLLGAFVHPLRLQYVEFFGKFYEDGGETFKPLGRFCKRTVIDKDTGGK